MARRMELSENVTGAEQRLTRPLAKGIYSSRQSVKSAVRATIGMASARSVRQPSVTRRHVLDPRSISSGVQPPSGPISTLVSRDGAASTSPSETASAEAWGSTNIKPGPGSVMSASDAATASNARGSRIAGTTARPHCFADATAIRCQRSRRWLRRSDASVTSLLVVTSG